MRSGRRRLALLVEGHDHDGRPVAADQPRLLPEVGLPVLQGDRVDDRLALHAPQPGLDHLPARRVDHERDARDLGFGREQVQEGDHRGFGVEQPLVHIDVDDLGAAAHLLPRHLDRGLVVAVADQAGEALRSRHVGALAHVHEERIGADREGFEAGEAGVRGGCGSAPGGDAVDRGRDRGDVLGRGAAAAAGEVEEAGAGEVSHGGGHRLGREVVAAEFVGQARVGVAADAEFADGGKFLEVGAERVGAQRAVEAEGERPGVAERVVEGLGGLSGQRAAALVGDRAGDHEGEAGAGAVELLHDREEGGLRVQRVEDGLDHEDVGAAFDQGAGLLAVRAAELLEGDVAGAGVVDVGRDRGRAVHGTEDPGHEAGAVGGAGRVLVGGLARDPGRRAVDLADRVLDPVVGHGQPGGGEGVGLDDVGAGAQVGAVDLADHVRARQAEEVVVAEQGGGVGAEMVAAEVVLGEGVPLDHGAHGAVKDEDAVVEFRLQRRLARPVAVRRPACGRHSARRGADGHRGARAW